MRGQNKAKHSPAPWKWQYDIDNDDLWLVAADGEAVALELTSWKPGRKKANRAVIAVAPELLAACKIAIEWLDPVCFEKYGMPEPEGIAACRQIEAAIAKAEPE